MPDTTAASGEANKAALDDVPVTHPPASTSELSGSSSVLILCLHERPQRAGAALAKGVLRPWSSQDPAFAREFLAAAVEDGVPLQQALGKVIRATGVKEFAAALDMPSSNLLRAIHPPHNPTQETLDRLLEPFGLRIGLAEIKRRKGRVA